MRLDQLPKTEEDYFVLIDCVTSTLGCGGTTPSEWVQKSAACKFDEGDPLWNLQRILVEMVNSLCDSFGIVNPISERRKIDLAWFSFDAWFKRMQRLYENDNYTLLICSVCPYSEGERAFKEKGSCIACSKNPKIRRLFRPWLCGMISHGIWQEEDLYKNMVKDFGEQTWTRFFVMMLNLSIQEVRNR
ncbi:MAG: hypothetical protein PHN19_04295 [Patescibacteria group bacterium]|nr:hypothetical protein [Patescibacteria group bacterium]